MPVTISTCTADALLMHQHTIQPHVAPCGYACAGLQSLTVSNVILEGTDNFPNHAIDLAGLLRPPLVPASTAVNLTNVALLHSVTAAQAAVAIATLRGMVSDPIVQRGIANWELQLYTVSMGRPAYSVMGIKQHAVSWEHTAYSAMGVGSTHRTVLLGLAARQLAWHITACRKGVLCVSYISPAR